ncbi:hypothetical protein WA026_002862 [Henosepilachna vigintioctopunctata]|uniref:PH domain-containing protein n=1 Tax=Henosepilachna vigintioctopunctata TaxID=420089 RepID=A0AAW1THL7_9CUCU
MTKSNNDDMKIQQIPEDIVSEFGKLECCDSESTSTIEATGNNESNHTCHKNKLEKRKTQQAIAFTNENEFDTTTPTEDSFEEFSKRIIQRAMGIEKGFREASDGERYQSSPRIKKPPRKRINSVLTEQSPYNNSEKLLELKSGNRKYRESSKGEATFLDSEATHSCNRIRKMTTMTVEEKLKKYFGRGENEDQTIHSIKNSSEFAYGTFKNYLRMLNSVDENGELKAIRDLVMSRYGGAIQNHLRKSVSRKSFVSLYKGISKESLRSRDSGNNSICDEFFDDDNNIPDGAFSLKTFEDILQYHNRSSFNTKFEEDSVRGLNENYKKQTEGNLRKYSNKQLVTKAECTCVTRVNTGLEPSDKPIKRPSSQPIMRTAQETSHVVNEKTQVESDTTEKELMQRLYIQTATILEVSKALNFCRKFKDYTESIERVEAEHILLIATIRRSLILDRMTETECESRNMETNGCVQIKDLKIPLIATDDNSKGDTYFACVFQCGNSVLSSGVLKPNGEIYLEINKNFCFEQLSHDFEINIQFYSIFIKNYNRSKISNAILKDVSNAFCNLRRYIPSRRSSRNFTESSTMKKSSFELCGRSMITRTSLQLKEFKVQTVYPAKTFTNKFTCEIDFSVKVPNTASGFLTVGEQFNGILLWNRQWCVLDNGKLRFWDYPGGKEATRVIEISRCLQRTISLADKSFCPRPRTLHLKLGAESVRDGSIPSNLYLAADSLEDLRYWSEKLNSVLTTLTLWNAMQRCESNTK